MSKRRKDLLVTGIMVLLAMGVSGCSTEASVVDDPAGAQIVESDIKVYESPT